jgi:hypothetical protein
MKSYAVELLQAECARLEKGIKKLSKYPDSNMGIVDAIIQEDKMRIKDYRKAYELLEQEATDERTGTD